MLAITKSARGLLTLTAAFLFSAFALIAPTAAQENRATIVQSQLLRPFPQFTSLTQDRMTIGRAAKLRGRE